MARSIDDYQAHMERERKAAPGDGGTTRSTARAFAAAISAFAISALVITSSADALEATGTVAGNELQAGTINLIDDDTNLALFDLQDMVPDRETIECIEVTYDGTIVPVDLTLTATSTGALAEFLELEIEQGTGAGFRDCEGFEPTDLVFEGRVDELAGVEGKNLGRFLNNRDSMSFRFTMVMVDEQDAVGQLSTIDFAWEVVPS